ncbi:MAG: EAL domain-containing protein [Cyanobacteria bacterium J06642_9]
MNKHESAPQANSLEFEFENSLGNQQLALRQDTDTRLREVRWSGLLGGLSVSVAFIGVAWSIVPSSILLSWWVIHVSLIGWMFCAQSGWLLKNWRDRNQAPRLLAIIYWVRGIWFGAIPLLNWDAFKYTEYFWITLAFAACFMAGQMVFNNILVDRLLTAVLILFAMTTFLKQEFLIGTGILVLLVISVKGMHKIQQSRINEVLLQIQLKHQAYRDGLTNILNRCGLEAVIATLPKTVCGAMFIDLDNFKDTNDRLGHEAGDQLLKQVTERIKPIIQDLGGVLARFGGDEFFVIFKNDNLTQLMTLAEQIIHTLEQPFSLPTGEAKISASIGITLSKNGQITLDQLYREADEAMYLSKQEQRDKVVYFDDILRQKSHKRREVKARLENAIQHQEIVAWGQPVIDLKDKKIVAVELLARWPQADQSMLTPSYFIPIAEELGLIEDVTLLMLKYATQYLTMWQAIPSLADTYITVNVSPRDLIQGQLLDEIITLSQQGRLNPAHLAIEITEREIIEAEDLVRDRIGQLHQLGVQVAIDDFGTGYSSFHSIVALPIDILKLDRSLISSIADDDRMQAAVSAILQMTTQLNIHSVGEGVEFEEDAKILQQLGLDLAQGFLYAKPMPLHEIPACLGLNQAQTLIAQ